MYLRGAEIFGGVGGMMQKTVSMSVTEEEFKTRVSYDQFMMYDLRVLESLELQVELPMLIIN